MTRLRLWNVETEARRRYPSETRVARWKRIGFVAGWKAAAVERRAPVVRPKPERPICAECGRDGYYTDVGGVVVVGHLDQRIRSHVFVRGEPDQ